MEETNEAQKTAVDHGSNIMTDDPSFHAIKIYNMVSDRIWDEFALLEQYPDMLNVISEVQKLNILLTRSDMIWYEIQKTIEEKTKYLKISNTSFNYHGELKNYADKLEHIVKIALNAEFYASNGSIGMREDAITYLEVPKNGRTEYIKAQVKKQILDAMQLWSEKASQINFTMPITIKDAQDPFL
jgi:hypothetical protein